MSAAGDWVFPKCPECGRGAGRQRSVAGCATRRFRTRRRRRSAPPPLRADLPPTSAEKRSSSRRAQVPNRQKPGSESLSEDVPTRIAILIGLNAALGIVGIGLWRRAPGLAVLYVLVVAPAVTAMYVSFDRQRHSDGLGRVGEFVDGILSVLARTFAILCLLVLAIFCALFLFCSIALLTIIARH